MIKKAKIAKDNVVKFPTKLTDIEKEIEAVIFAAAEPLDVDTIESKISKKSNVQVININNQKELKNYFKKNLLENELVICLGAGSISNWIREIGDKLK